MAVWHVKPESTGTFILLEYMRVQTVPGDFGQVQVKLNAQGVRLGTMDMIRAQKPAPRVLKANIRWLCH